MQCRTVLSGIATEVTVLSVQSLIAAVLMMICRNVDRHSLLDAKINSVLSLCHDQVILNAVHSIIQNMIACEDVSQQQLSYLQSKRAAPRSAARAEQLCKRRSVVSGRDVLKTKNRFRFDFTKTEPSHKLSDRNCVQSAVQIKSDKKLLYVCR